MSNLTDWINYELYPALFEVIDQALPEHSFNRYPGGWMSRTYLNGSPHPSRRDKTKVKKGAPYYIFEEGGRGQTIIDYIQERDGIEFIEAVRKLAEVAGLQLPKDLSWDGEAYKKRKDRETLLEEANGYFMFCLGNAKGSKEVRDYLTGRGYTPEDVKGMELGYIPNPDGVIDYLTGKGYDKETAIGALGITQKRIGASHTLTIPYRSGGTIKGFKFRTTEPGLIPKYLNSSGMDKKGGFFNLSPLTGDKDLVVVEGELDALHATVKGIDNIVATGGADLHPEQIADAKRRGAKSITLCFDQEPGVEDKIFKALEILREDEELRVYVAVLPDLGSGKTDPDGLIKEKGAEAFKKVIDGAFPWYEHNLFRIWEKYKNIDGGNLTPKQLDGLREEIIILGLNIKTPIQRGAFLNKIADEAGADIMTRETLEQTLEILRYKKDQETQARELKKLLSEATVLHDKGETARAINKLLERGRELTGLDRKQEYEKLLQIPGEDDIKKTIQGEADSLETGYTLRDQLGTQEGLLLPSGALSIIAGRTSHRKTTLLLNIAINTARKYQDKEIHYFSYEESREALLIKLMNIYINETFKHRPNNLRYIKGYYKSGGATYHNTDFLEGKDRFYQELIYPGRLRVHYTPLDIDGLAGAIEYLNAKGRVGAIFIDYIQLLRIRGDFQSRQLQLQEICERLRETAIKTRLPVILGAQFNREVTMEGEIDPGKIREAGDIEQTANLVLGLWDRAFTKQGGPKGKEHKDRKGETARYEPGILYVEVLKGRDIGAGAYGELSYNGNTWKVENKNYFVEDRI
jgi:DNA primase catalytic core